MQQHDKSKHFFVSLFTSSQSRIVFHRKENLSQSIYISTLDKDTKFLYLEKSKIYIQNIYRVVSISRCLTTY